MIHDTYSNHICWKMEVGCMSQKLPYYLTYPMLLELDDQRKEQKDYEYMKSLYPETAKKLLPYIEEECDRLEYTCSMIYDEYPDKVQLHILAKHIFEKFPHNEKEENYIFDFIEIMLYHEIYKRRRDDRRSARKFY